MKTLALMTSNCGTVRTATLADDGEIIFSDGSKSTEHIDKGFSAATVFVAMWMHKDALLRYKPASAHSSMFNNTIRALGNDRPTAVTAHIFSELMGKNSVVMLDGTEYYFVSNDGRKVARPSGNVYRDRYNYADVADYSFIDYVMYRNSRRVANFNDGSAWEIAVDAGTFDLMCRRYQESDNKGKNTGEWFKAWYFIGLTNDLAAANAKSHYAEQLNIFNYDASPIFCDDAPEPSSFTRGVLYGVCAVAFILFMSSAYMFNQCFGAY